MASRYRFPVPVGAASVTLRLTLDERYTPSARGGNPCPRGQAATPSAPYACNLCVTGPWDHASKAGWYLLWSVPGLGKHLITGPYPVMDKWVAKELFLVEDSPPELDLAALNATDIVVTVFVYGQYPYTGELVDGVSGYSKDKPTKCSVGWTKNTSSPSDSYPNNFGNIQLGLLKTSVFTRNTWKPKALPPVGRPRLFGNDSAWGERFNDPFYDADCTHAKAFNPGWGTLTDSGFPDVKSVFERATLGYSTCYGAAPGDIWSHGEVESYMAATFKSHAGEKSRTVALKVLHLLRRMRACHAKHGQGTGAAACQFNATETQKLSDAVYAKELANFGLWSWENPHDSKAGYDLETSVAIIHWSLFTDILVPAGGKPEAMKVVFDKLERYIGLFMESFKTGDWSLWNGNNWTPVLCEGALYWAIAFFHENEGTARDVIKAVNDISTLHRDKTTANGAYMEGVCQYSYMSMGSSLSIAVLYVQSFGERWPALDVGKTEKMLQWHADSFDTTGRAVNFGDSHDCTGTRLDSVYAWLSRSITAPFHASTTPESAPAVPLSASALRMWASVVYYVTITDPWGFWPEVAHHDWATLLLGATSAPAASVPVVPQEAPHSPNGTTSGTTSATLCTASGVQLGPVSKAICADTADTCEVYIKRGSENGVTGINTCLDYCTAYGLTCKAQHDDNNNCVRKTTYPSCDDDGGGSSDHICECGPPGATTTTAAEVSSTPLCTGKGVALGAVSKEVCANTPTTCEVYIKVGDENGATGIDTCRAYCKVYGMVCEAQYDDTDSCTRGAKYPSCDDLGGGSSDHICQCGPPPVFLEDFSARLDAGRWLVAEKKWPSSATNGGVLPENVFLPGDGTLRLVANGDRYTGPVRGLKDRSGARLGHGRRTGAAIATKQYFASGEYEVRMKVAPTKGVCSAIWTFYYEETYPPDGKVVIVNHEVDIELPGRPGPKVEDVSFSSLLANTWVGEKASEHSTGYTPNLATPQDDGKFHVYKFVWHTGDTDTQQAKRVEFFVDGASVHNSTEHVPTRAGRLWVGAWFPEEWAGDPNFATSELVIDYVKITPLHETGDAFVNESYPDDGWGSLGDTRVVAPSRFTGHQPLGPAHTAVYPVLGQATIRTPLLDTCSTEADTLHDCSAPHQPNLRDPAMYSSMALQGRPNAYPHSEVDFGTFKWSAYGAELLSEHGYGVIATAIAPWDHRRYGQPDNNPVGHNTVIIREAFAKNSDEINFSQLSYRAGATSKVTGVALDCILLDGSEVYGASHASGWLSHMMRWTCAVGTGQFVMLDSFAAKANRTAFSVGAFNDGPTFTEGAGDTSGRATPYQDLTIDEYFHSPSWLNNKDIAGMSTEEKVFDRTKAGSRPCMHAEGTLSSTGFNGTTRNDVLRLTAGCGFPQRWTAGNARGTVTAWSASGGSFTSDGLVSTENRWFAATKHIHRYRYAPEQKTSAAGEVRAFAFVASSATPTCNGVEDPAECLGGKYLGRCGVSLSGVTTNDHCPAMCGACTATRNQQGGGVPEYPAATMRPCHVHTFKGACARSTGPLKCTCLEVCIPAEASGMGALYQFVVAGAGAMPVLANATRTTGPSSVNCTALSPHAPPPPVTTPAPTQPTQRPSRWNDTGYRLIWDVDNSYGISTPPRVVRGDKGLPVTRWNRANNGRAVTIYGNKGRMPHYSGSSVVNGGVPQQGNLTTHLVYYRRDLAALIPEADYEGYCLLDYEYWRADWNSSSSAYKTKSIELAGGDEALAEEQFEAAAKLFIMATINATRDLRPGCKVGSYGYPRNNLPFTRSASYDRWCAQQTEGVCFFDGYAEDDSGDAQRRLNDKLLWMWDALDAITPSIYLGLKADETTDEAAASYVTETVAEAVRLADLVEGSGGVRPEVLPFTWHLVNNYWQDKTGPRVALTLNQSRTQYIVPREAGADGVLMWGSVCGVPTIQQGGPVCADMVNTTQGSAGHQLWMDTTLQTIVKELDASRPTTTAPAPSSTTAAAATCSAECDARRWRRKLP